jgi:hypothetical protein
MDSVAEGNEEGYNCRGDSGFLPAGRCTRKIPKAGKSGAGLLTGIYETSTLLIHLAS